MVLAPLTVPCLESERSCATPDAEEQRDAASITGTEVMNLIVGVLVEVVGVVAAAEQEAATRNAIFEALQEAS